MKRYMWVCLAFRKARLHMIQPKVFKKQNEREVGIIHVGSSLRKLHHGINSDPAQDMRRSKLG